ncbi:MAG: STAS domain-containing protein [Acidobacteria bacterium]|nr:STAS domain-containing protein [Acidobacteriota bacterium]
MDRVDSGKADVAVIGLNGKLSLETVHDFIETMRPEPAQVLILDMSKCSFLDSAGVGALISIFVSRRNHGKKLILAGLTSQGQAVMQVSGLIKLLPLYPLVEDAIAVAGK